eukprot:15347752-Ditylum_brightwellii.AAC.2
MSGTWQHEDKSRELFVLSRMDLITSPAMYKQLLRIHNAYIQNVTAVAMEGLHPTVVEKDIAVGGVKMSVREYLTTRNRKIHSMERTNLSKE